MTRSGREPCSTRAAASAVIYRLESLEKRGLGGISRLAVFDQGFARIGAAQLRWRAGYGAGRCRAWPDGMPRVPAAREVPFKPARVILQDFTGVPAVVDLAAMRSAMKRLGGDPAKINPWCRSTW